jgi:hypothetical protein
MNRNRVRGIAIFFVALLAAMPGCVSMQDALVPDEMDVWFGRGKMHGQEWPNEPYYSGEHEPDQDFYQFGVGFTWKLRRDERAELRAIRALMERKAVTDES